jgi:hypothetical protein
LTLDLFRIYFKDGIRAADSRLVWASSVESALALGEAWCAPFGYRFIRAERETVAREGDPLPAAPEVPGVVRAVKPLTDKLPPAAVYATAVAK